MNPTVLERLSKFAGKLLGASVNLSPKNGTVAQKGFYRRPVWIVHASGRFATDQFLTLEFILWFDEGDGPIFSVALSHNLRWTRRNNMEHKYASRHWRTP